jgi:glycine cleavage system H protein
MADTGSKTLLYPAELKYVKTHEWVRIEGDSATIGITSFAADQLGDVTFVELPKVGSKFKKEEKFGVIESVKSVSDLFMPMGGEITAVNDKLTSEAELVNLDCYGEGWMLKIKMDNKADLDDSLSADDYKKFVVE